ncbi:DUF4369 domain-containing protein [Tenacibaculum maritimum]|uniref:DUF4369 domain-containing protein n=1 Tax=Tenacibaculum maritimum TaxID=107401 RepID=UPI0003F9973F|nr:DUF4369 domain-containing protein [Tenacibaculum maritimum]
MRKFIAICTISLLVFACSSKKEGNMIVQGQIKGLKKGTLYLQKMKDTLLVSVDSISLLGNDHFSLADNINEPQMYYLTFGNNSSTSKRIMFFGEKGTIKINDKIEEFGFKPKIEGSKNQKIIEQFKEIDRKFRDQRLDFIKKDFEARKTNNQELVNELEQGYKRMMRRRFLFTTNYAINNAHTEASPYIALTELFDANIKLLDTINNSLSDKIKKSMYGKRLQKFITDVKSKEK